MADSADCRDPNFTLKFIPEPEIERGLGETEVVRVRVLATIQKAIRGNP